MLRLVAAGKSNREIARRARDQRAHGRAASPEHLREARRLVAAPRRLRSPSSTTSSDAHLVVRIDHARIAGKLVNPRDVAPRAPSYHRSQTTEEARDGSAVGERFDTVIVGGGQAGLATGYHLAKQGRAFVILDASERVGDPWRERWDSLRLYSPARYDGLPGCAYPGRRSFPDDTRDGRLPRGVRGALRATRPHRHGRGHADEGGRTLRRDGRCDRRSRQTTWSWRRASCRSRGSDLRRRSSTRASRNSTRATTATSRSFRRGLSWWSARATRAPTSPTRQLPSTRRSCREETQARSLRRSRPGAGGCRLPRALLRRLARADDGHAARSQDAPAHQARRCAAPAVPEEGSARRGSRARLCAYRRRAGRPAGARRRPRPRRPERGLVHRLPSRLHVDQDPARAGRGRLSRSSTAAPSPRRPASTSWGCCSCTRSRRCSSGARAKMPSASRGRSPRNRPARAPARGRVASPNRSHREARHIRPSSGRVAVAPRLERACGVDPTDRGRAA